MERFRTAAPGLGILALAIVACQPAPEPPGASGASATSGGSGELNFEPDAPAPVADAPDAPNADEPQLLTPLPPDNPDPEVQAIVDRVLAGLVAHGFDPNQQTVWVQTDDRLLAQWRGTTPLPAASVTKIATALAALRAFEPEHRFVTELAATGPIANGVLDGDLVVIGGRDPMFVWEDAIAVGNELNAIGIREVRGELVVVGDFFMNFEQDVADSAELLAIGLDARRWTNETRAQHATLPAGTPQPQVAIGGAVRSGGAALGAPSNAQPLLSNASRPLAELLDQMNRYSNNAIAQIIADSAGGAAALEREVLAATGVDPSEVQLINGSGLGRENQLSPRAAAMMYRAINRQLAPHGLTVADVVAVAGVDPGILQDRPLPDRAVLKSGSLNAVSTMSGGIPTASGVIWLGMMNGGNDFEAMRAAQETLIAELEAWGGQINETLPALAPTPDRDLAPVLRRLP
ncbi:MAG: D-alanyl-D-alanine carboxypeptidase [Geitlerinemataceae cyanobacterium]